MPKLPKDPRIDTYIQDAEPFARPILKQLRAMIHQSCPQAEETLKWSCPHFLYQGKILFGMGAFKKHVLCGFWNGRLIKDSAGKAVKMAMGDSGHIKTLGDLPSKKAFADYVKQAMVLGEAGKSPAKRPTKVKKKPPSLIPPALKRALAANKKAQKNFDGFSPSKQREYNEWISSAKTEETLERRLETAVEWIAEGKSRNWKYQ